MNTLPIAQKIQAKYLRAVNCEMFGNYQPAFVANLMRRIVDLIFHTPDFATDIAIDPRRRDYYDNALIISAYLGYVQYEIIADDTIAHITLTDHYRAQILASATPSEPTPADNAPTPSDDATAAPPPTPEPAECSECSEPPRAAANFRLKAVTTASLTGSLCNSRGQGRRGRPQPSDSQPQRKKSERRNLAPHKPRPSPLSPTTPAPSAPTLDNAAPSECSECSECSKPPIVAANFRLKAVTTASLEGSLCNSRGQGRPGRPQPSDSHQQRIKSERRHLAPQNPPTPPIAMPQPHPPRPPTTRLSAALS